nr:hypothetical protein BaRGS_025112 [Batillaria attramentaria]
MVILFLVSSIESNVIDQRWLEFKVHQLNHNIRIIRRTLLDIHSRASLSHNLYGNEMKTRLEEIGSTPQREAYILMERIFPLPEKNYLIKTGLPFTLTDIVSELGIYGVHIGSGEKEMVNLHCGHMLRSKVKGTDEGGIVAGFAALDTPFIVDV